MILKLPPPEKLHDHPGVGISKSIVGSWKVQRYFPGSSDPSHGSSGQSSRMRTSEDDGSTASVGDAAFGSGSAFEHDATRNIVNSVAAMRESKDPRVLISRSPSISAP